MFNKLSTIISKLLFQYIAVIIISFILSSLFIKEKKSLFINLNPKNNKEEIISLIESFFNGKTIKEQNTILKKLKQKGSFVYPVLFEMINNDSLHKNEYAKISDYLGIIKDCPEYNIDCHKKKYSLISFKYKSKYIKNLLNAWIIHENKRKNIEKELMDIGKFAFPEILSFLVIHDRMKYKDTINLYKILNKTGEKKVFTESDYQNENLIKEYYKYFYHKNKYYYQKNTFLNKLKTSLTDTEFFNWFSSALTMSFGTINKKSTLVIMKKYMLRTITIVSFVIFITYFITIYLTLIFKRKKNLFYLIFDKTIHILSVTPPFILIIFFIIIAKLFNLSDFQKLLQYLILMSTISVIIIFRNMESLIIKEKNKPQIRALKFFWLDEKNIFKKYIYKDMNTALLENIKNLITKITAYLIIIEYILNFNGVGNFFMNSLIHKDYVYLRISTYTIGVMIIIFKTFTDVMISMTKKEIYVYNSDI